MSHSNFCEHVWVIHTTPLSPLMIIRFPSEMHEARVSVEAQRRHADRSGDAGGAAARMKEDPDFCSSSEKRRGNFSCSLASHSLPHFGLYSDFCFYLVRNVCLVALNVYQQSRSSSNSLVLGG